MDFIIEFETCAGCGREVQFINETCPFCRSKRPVRDGERLSARPPTPVSKAPSASAIASSRSVTARESVSSPAALKTVPAAHENVAADFRALLDLATPDLYERNAFRLLEVHVEATDRDLSKRKQVMEVAARNKLPVPSGPCRILPRTPTPDDHEIRECSHAIQDAERRLAHEFFWFWPLAHGQAADDPALQLMSQGRTDESVKLWQAAAKTSAAGPAAKHNLAVTYHFSALEWERTLLNGSHDEANTKEAERYWDESMRHWYAATSEESSWSRLTARIRAIDDRSLTTGASRRIEHSLPVALTLIDARLAIRAYELGKNRHAQRHVARLNGRAVPEEALAQALRVAVDPVRAMIKTICEAAKKDRETDPAKADTVAERVLDLTAKPLGLLDVLLANDNPARVAEHDQVALTALSCLIAFGNKTTNWKRTSELIERLRSLAASTAAKERIEENCKTVRDNLESSRCFFCKQEESKDDATLEVKMHGNVQRIPTYGGVQVTWQHCTVGVPRCPACKAAHSRLDTGMGLGALVGGLMGLPGCFAIVNADGDAWFGGLIVIGILTGIGSGIGYAIASSMKPKGVRPESSKSEHPRIKELLAEGWAWGEAPNTQ